MYRLSFTLAIASASTLFAFVNAQTNTTSTPSPTSTSGISPCVLNCAEQASTSAGCSGILDIQCLCTSSAFQSAVAACLQANCTTAEIDAGQGMQQQCAAFSTTSSASASNTPTDPNGSAVVVTTVVSASDGTPSSAVPSSTAGAATHLASSNLLGAFLGILVLAAGAGTILV